MEEIGKITIEEKNYPQLLRKIPDPPKILYFRGKIGVNELCFAVVGTRLCSPYGKQATIEIVSELTERGVTIVSGLAPGIDTCAHLAAVEKEKRTIAVLGTGLDEKSIYPKENIKLARKIVELGGCLISEYPAGTSGNRFTFPQRNRIISGLSSGVLVVEAKEKSGALITANQAFLQKRKVFAIPGPIYSLNSRGPHILIKRGAKLVDNVEDILKELNLSGLKPDEIKSLKGEGPEENLILEALKEGALYIDKIIEKTKLETAKVASIITILEMKGRVRNLGENTYALRR